MAVQIMLPRTTRQSPNGERLWAEEIGRSWIRLKRQRSARKTFMYRQMRVTTAGGRDLLTID